MARVRETKNRLVGGKAIALAVLLSLLGAVGVLSAEDPDIEAIKRRIEEVDAEIENTMSSMSARYVHLPAGSLDNNPERIVSLNKNAQVTITGDFRLNYTLSNSTRVDKSLPDAFAAPQQLGKSSLGDLALTRENIGIDARMGERWRGFVEFKLSSHSSPYTIYGTRNPNRGAANPTADYPRVRLESSINDNLGEAYIELLKNSHSGFGFRAGNIDLPFGVAAKPDLFTKSFLDSPDLTGSFLMSPLGQTDSPRLPHASKLAMPVTAVQVSYEMRDIVRFEAALFQDARLPEDRYFLAGDKYVSSDPGFLRSWQLGVSLLPLEDWELSLGFRNRYDRNRGVAYWANSPYRSDFLNNLASGKADPAWDAGRGQWSDDGTGPGFGSRKSEQAFFAGLALEIPNTKLSLFAEYAHGWNQGFNRYVHSDSVNVGLGYRLLPRLTLYGQAEWLYVKDRSWMVADGAGSWLRDVRKNSICRFMIGAEYELASGLVLEGGLQYENWHFRSSYGNGSGGSARKTLRADTLYLGTKFSF